MVSQLKIVFVTKMVGTFRAVSPTVAALMAAGHRVTIMAEDLSVSKWREAGYSPPVLMADVSASDVEGQLVLIKPDVIVVGCGNPTNLEDEAAHAANKLGIPLVVFEDIWGVGRRVSAEPQMIFTADLVGEKFLRQETRFREAMIVQIGLALGELTPTEEERKTVDRLRKEYGRVIVLAGQGESTGEILNALLLSLAWVKSDERFLVVPCWHPTQKTNPRRMKTWETQVGLWTASCARDHSVVSTSLTSGVRNDALSELADITVGGHSALLLNAARGRRLPVSVRMPSARADLLSCGVGYDTFPGIDAGIAAAMDGPVEDFFGWLDIQRAALLAAQDAYFAKPPMSAADIANTIASVASMVW